jgi:hypothetical protein
MSSTARNSEILTCTQYGRIFNTIEDLNQHQKSEQPNSVEK